MIVPISPRGRKYGYVIWSSKLDQQMLSALGTTTSMEVTFNGKYLGKKNIDWSSRRISLGASQTRALPENAKDFILEPNGGRLIVSAR